MARSKKEEDAPVDQYGRPLPLVKLVKNGVEVDVRDPAGLTNLHYGQGFDFVEDGMTYSTALAELLREEQLREAVVEVPEEGDFSWPQPVQDVAVADGEAADTKAGNQKGKKTDD